VSISDRQLARRIIEQLGSSGQPPEFGVQYFSAGIDPYLSVIKDEYLANFIPDGGSAFKLVVGIYGGGKTHFLYCIRNQAWEQNLAVSYVSLKSGGECPFDRLDLVYKAIINGLLPPVNDSTIALNEVKGIENFLRYWYKARLDFHRGEGKSSAMANEAIREEIDTINASSMYSISFRHAIVKGLSAVQLGSDRLFDEICQWFKGEAPPTATLKNQGITQRVDKTTAFSFIRSLGQTMRPLGYNGLIILLDEAERVPSLSRGQREQLLSNLRELIDECSQPTFAGMMIFYAVPDRGFLDGRTQIYEALRQRLDTEFNHVNPAGVRLELDNVISDPATFLRDVGEKIVPIYNTAYGQTLETSKTNKLIGILADWAVRQRFADAGYKRLFVQRLIGGLGVVHRQGRVPTPEELK
jgi:hypothetical protein